MSNSVTELVARAPMEPLLKVEDLEKLFQIDRRTVARLCKRGQLPPPLKLGGGNRWKADDIAAAIDVLERQPGRVGKHSNELVLA